MMFSVGLCVNETPRKALGIFFSLHKKRTKRIPRPNQIPFRYSAAVLKQKLKLHSNVVILGFETPELLCIRRCLRHSV